MTEPETIEADVAEVLESLPAVRVSTAIVARDEITVDEVVAQKDKIKQVMERVMVDGTHFGVIPGTNKPTLLKPGAEAILVALRLAPHYESEKVVDGEHLTVFVRCELQHIPTSLVVATGEGMCTSRESKYAYRTARRTCPACGVAAIIKGKAEYGGGWLCWKKNDPPGCGTKYADADVAITEQVEGKVPNPELPDTWNTVLKMADKRALIAAVLNGTAASDVFTQDVEDSTPAARTEAQATRKEGVPAYPVPKNWVEIEKAIRYADNPEEAWELFGHFVTAASYHLYGETETKKLKGQKATTLRQKAAGAAAWLHDNIELEGPNFLFFDQAAQRKAWAAMLGGALLEIPDYVESKSAPDPDDDPEALAMAREVFQGES